MRMLWAADCPLNTWKMYEIVGLQVVTDKRLNFFYSFSAQLEDEALDSLIIIALHSNFIKHYKNIYTNFFILLKVHIFSKALENLHLLDCLTFIL